MQLGNAWQVMLLGLFLMIKSHMVLFCCVFYKAAQNTNEPSGPRRRSVNDMLVLGPLWMLHTCFRSALRSFFLTHAQPNRKGSGGLRAASLMSARPLPLQRCFEEHAVDVPGVRGGESVIRSVFPRGSLVAAWSPGDRERSWKSRCKGRRGG